MTAKEAISQLQERIDLINKDYFDLQLDKYAEALEMAIEALSHLADPAGARLLEPLEADDYVSEHRGKPISCRVSRCLNPGTDERGN